MNHKRKKTIKGYLLSYKKYVVGMIAGLITTSSVVLLLSHNIGYVIDQALVQHNEAMLNKSLIYFLLLASMLAVATGLRFNAINKIGEYVIRDIKRDMYKQILSMAPSFYDNNSTGGILSRFNADTAVLQSVLGNSISVFLRNSIMLVGSLLMISFSSIKLTIMTVLIIPFVLIPITIVGRKVKILSKQHQERVADLSSIAEETIFSMKVIQAYAREDLHKQIFEDKSTDLIQNAKHRITIRTILIISVICMMFCGIGTILWIGGRDVLAGNMTPGQLSSFIFLALLSSTTAASITESFGEIQKAIGATNRIMEFLSIKPTIHQVTNATPAASTTTGNLVFKNVSFGYIDKKNVIERLSFEATSGKLLAIVGESGAGKSTIIQLILRFYDVQRGEILLNGVNIKNMLLKELRENFGYVGQEPTIFSTSAYHNIAYAKPDASMEEVIEAAKAASALKFIEKLPHGFDTFLGEKGAKLSGGQKQRISIARAILKNPKILLLDEATSALDNANENVIQKALDQLMKDRTTIVIAHRMSTIVNADEIMLLKAGKVIARGSHQTLLQTSPEYITHFAINLEKNFLQEHPSIIVRS